MDARIRTRVRERAGSRCEYCRQHAWSEHFEWRGIHLHGKTAVGRTTIRVLQINSDDQLALRSL